jgi:hypothetical protein
MPLKEKVLEEADESEEKEEKHLLTPSFRPQYKHRTLVGTGSLKNCWSKVAYFCDEFVTKNLSVFF